MYEREEELQKELDGLKKEIARHLFSNINSEKFLFFGSYYNYPDPDTGQIIPVVKISESPFLSALAKEFKL